MADLFALGGFPEADAELVATHAPPGSIENALELGSGKGAVSMALARRLGCDVIGVDGLASFVRDANQRAAEAGLAAARPFGSMTDLHAALSATLSEEQCAELYTQLFIPINLNTATREEIESSLATLARHTVDIAVLMAEKIVRREVVHTPHGEPSGALTFGTPDSPGVPEEVARQTITVPYNDLDAVRKAFEKAKGDVAAVFV